MSSHVVVGCGIAGLAAAAALRSTGAEVVLVERDRLPQEPTVRRGVPQGEQLHNLLARAQLELERLMPGLCDELCAAGAAAAIVAQQTHVYELGRRMPERDLGLRLMSAPRPLIEDVARRLVLRRGGITVRDGTRATGLILSRAGTLEGVTLKADDGSISELRAAIVVDATGTVSPAPRWLQVCRKPAPAVEHQHVGQWYVSTRFRRPAEWVGEPDCWLVFATAPKTRSGLVSPDGREHWYVSLSGRAGDARPATTAAFQLYAESLEDPWIARLMDSAQPVSAPIVFRKPTSRWRRYDLLADPVPGFLPIGDAIASLNPLFGQGMSVAAWQARILADLMEGSPRPPATALPGLTRAYLRQAADVARTALQLGAAIEGAMSDGRREAFARALEDDPALHSSYVGIWHLLEPASSLTGAHAPWHGDRPIADQP